MIMIMIMTSWNLLVLYLALHTMDNKDSIGLKLTLYFGKFGKNLF